MPVALNDLIEKMHFKSLTDPKLNEDAAITQADVNRPALQLTGYFEHFDASRLQIIGYVESAYIQKMKKAEKKQIFTKLLSFDIPCFVFSRGLEPDPLFLELAKKTKTPILSSTLATSEIMAEVIRWLNVKLAPSIRIHGVLVDVYGEGVLITGESGIGKSEAALELIRRGHRLVSDDVVEIHKVSDDTLYGTAPAVTRYLLELRGIGVIDVRTLFGVSGIRDTATIDLNIHLEEWDKDKDYDRFGMDEHYAEYLGNKIVCHNIPIRPGRNLAVICEAAAANHRQKRLGYNAAQELYNRVQSQMQGGGVSANAILPPNTRDSFNNNRAAR